MMVSRRRSVHLSKIRTAKYTDTFYAILAFLQQHCTARFTFDLSVIGHAGARSDHSYVSETPDDARL